MVFALNITGNAARKRADGSIGCGTWYDANGTIVHRRIYAILSRTWNGSPEDSFTRLMVSDPDCPFPVPANIDDTAVIDCEMWA